jgi:ankyrin repeat protein
MVDETNLTPGFFNIFSCDGNFNCFSASSFFASISFGKITVVNHNAAAGSELVETINVDDLLPRELSKEEKLFAAIAEGKDEVALELITEGLDFNAVNKEKYSLIDEAAYHKRMAVIAALVDHGVNTATIIGCCEGILNEAVTGGYKSVVNALIRDGIDVNAAAPTTYHDGVRYEKGDAALIAAVAHGRVDMVRILVADHKINVHIKNPQGLSALDYANYGRFTEIAEILTAKAAEPVPSAEMKPILDAARAAGDRPYYI